ncbi:hypothetical protein ABGO80_000606 [Salmonella enterica subsp. enterica serovar Braenderup]
MFDKKFLQENERKIPIAERLESKTVVLENGCHEFTGGKDKSGYGKIKIGSHQVGAHKVSYLLNVGDYDQTSQELLHSCDNPACVNPAHLKPGTHRENIQDCISKGRHTFQLTQVDGVSARQQAIAEGRPTYHGSMCSKHNTTERSVVNGACVGCREEYKVKKREQRRVARNAA